MSFSGKPTTRVELAIENDGFWPNLDVGEFQKGYRLPGEYLVEGHIDPQVVATVTAWCARLDVLANDMRVEQRSLEDVFLDLTGRELRS